MIFAKNQYLQTGGYHNDSPTTIMVALQYLLDNFNKYTNDLTNYSTLDEQIKQKEDNITKLEEFAKLEEFQNLLKLEENKILVQDSILKYQTALLYFCIICKINKDNLITELIKWVKTHNHVETQVNIESTSTPKSDDSEKQKSVSEKQKSVSELLKQQSQTNNKFLFNKDSQYYIDKITKLNTVINNNVFKPEFAKLADIKIKSRINDIKNKKSDSIDCTNIETKQNFEELCIKQKIKTDKVKLYDLSYTDTNSCDQITKLINDIEISDTVVEKQIEEKEKTMKIQKDKDIIEMKKIIGDKFEEKLLTDSFNNIKFIENLQKNYSSGKYPIPDINVYTAISCEINKFYYLQAVNKFYNLIEQMDKSNQDKTIKLEQVLPEEFIDIVSEAKKAENEEKIARKVLKDAITATPTATPAEKIALEAIVIAKSNKTKEAKGKEYLYYKTQYKITIECFNDNVKKKIEELKKIYPQPNYITITELPDKVELLVDLSLNNLTTKDIIKKCEVYKAYIRDTISCKYPTASSDSTKKQDQIKENKKKLTEIFNNINNNFLINKFNALIFTKINSVLLKINIKINAPSKAIVNELSTQVEEIKHDIKIIELKISILELKKKEKDLLVTSTQIGVSAATDAINKAELAKAKAEQELLAAKAELAKTAKTELLTAQNKIKRIEDKISSLNQIITPTKLTPKELQDAENELLTAKKKLQDAKQELEIKLQKAKQEADTQTNEQSVLNELNAAAELEKNTIETVMRKIPTGINQNIIVIKNKLSDGVVLANIKGKYEKDFREDIDAEFAPFMIQNMGKIDLITDFMTELETKYPVVPTGGNITYKQKYLKYKIKYMQLKKQSFA